jgi:CheY-like chemotaxis protein
MMTRTGSFAQGPFPAGETGDEVYKRIRDVAPHLPIVIMTAKTRESLNSQYPLDQNTHIFLKPIDSAMVAKLVKLLKNI